MNYILNLDCITVFSFPITKVEDRVGATDVGALTNCRGSLNFNCVIGMNISY